jgi:hypothetical protein
MDVDVVTALDPIPARVILDSLKSMAIVRGHVTFLSAPPRVTTEELARIMDTLMLANARLDGAALHARSAYAIQIVKQMGTAAMECL